MTLINGLMQSLNSIIGSYGLIGFTAAMIIQAVVAPIPGEIVLMAGGAVFGWLNAGIIGEVAGSVGAILCFLISRRGGRPLVTKLVGSKGLEFADRWFKKHGMWAVLLARLIPLIPVDAVSYGAGLTAMDIKRFIGASVIGMIPRAFFYAYLGEAVAGQMEVAGIERAYLNILLILVLAITMILAYKYISHRVVDKK